jgi:FixJ family two-component response regulator
MQSHVVAVVEDDPGVRAALSALLSAWGYGCELFASGAEFLAAAATSAAECLVVDVQLGEISGLELARRLAAAGCNLPIIFVTGADDEAIRRQAAALGCVALLHKPFPGYALLVAIVKATRRAVHVDGLGEGGAA